MFLVYTNNSGQRYLTNSQEEAADFCANVGGTFAPIGALPPLGKWILRYSWAPYNAYNRYGLDNLPIKQAPQPSTVAAQNEWYKDTLNGLIPDGKYVVKSQLEFDTKEAAFEHLESVGEHVPTELIAAMVAEPARRRAENYKIGSIMYFTSVQLFRTVQGEEPPLFYS